MDAAARGGGCGDGGGGQPPAITTTCIAVIAPHAVSGSKHLAACAGEPGGPGGPAEPSSSSMPSRGEGRRMQRGMLSAERRGGSFCLALTQHPSTAKPLRSGACPSPLRSSLPLPARTRQGLRAAHTSGQAARSSVAGMPIARGLRQFRVTLLLPAGCSAAVLTVRGRRVDKGQRGPGVRDGSKHQERSPSTASRSQKPPPNHPAY